MSNNSLAKHGPISLAKNRKYLEHMDGTPFFFLADTWWYGATNRTPMLVFKTLVRKRKKQGFSAVQIVVGIPPEISAKDAKKIDGNPFNNDLSLKKDYFDEADQKIKYLVENGIVPIIFGGWGHHMDVLGFESIKKLWHEIVDRYSSYPVVWCLAGEIDLDSITIRHSGLSRISHYHWRFWMRHVKTWLTRMTFSRSHFLKKRIKQWSEIGDYISKIDKFKRPITAHVSRKTTVSNLIGNKKWLSINTIQSGHSKDSIPFMVGSILRSSKNNIPIINMEPWYEGILGNFGDFEQRYAFWACLLSGAKGHSYGAHGIWQMSKKGENFMKHWGDSYWQKALGFAGAEQLGFAKNFLEKYEWWKLEPCFEKITPHWTEDDVYLPVAARIEEKHFFIYVPRVGEVGEIGIKDLWKKDFYKAIFLLPDSMRIIDRFKFKGKESIIPKREINSQDLLIVVSRT